MTTSGGHTETGGEGRHFPSTAWSILHELKDPDATASHPALPRLLNLYWKPVYCYLRRAWKQTNDDAKDLTQEFFTRMVVEGNLIKRFNPERGSFRSFLKASVTNFMRDVVKTSGRVKRGGRATTIPLQVADVDLSEIVRDPDALTPEQVFEVAWKHSVITKALELMQERFAAEGKTDHYEVFRRFEVERKSLNVSYKSIAADLGLTEVQVKKYLERARKEYRKAIMAVVFDYVDNQEDFENELKHLFGG